MANINQNVSIPDQLVSVIMTSFNYSKYINEAIESILNQSYTDWYLIIVDDGSIDDSISIISTYVTNYPDKICLLTHPGNSNLNIKASLELAFTRVKGNYVAFLESDDVWKPDYLEKKIKSLKNFKDVSLVFSDLELIGNKEAITYKYKDYLSYCRFVGKLNRNKPFDALKYIVLRNPVVSFSNIVIRRNLLDKLDLTNEFEIWSDWWIIFQAWAAGRFYYIDEILFSWRIHKKSANASYMKITDPYLRGSMFKLAAGAMLTQKLSQSGDETRLRNYLKLAHSLSSHKHRILHDLGFALYSPMSVVRTFFRVITRKQTI